MEIWMGIGMDVYQLSVGVLMYVVGFFFFDERVGLVGYFDGDVVCYVICDVLLLVIGLGDIGLVFGIVDLQWVGVVGVDLVGYVVVFIVGKGWIVQNVVVQVIGQRLCMVVCRVEVEIVLV